MSPRNCATSPIIANVECKCRGEGKVSTTVTSRPTFIIRLKNSWQRSRKQAVLLSASAHTHKCHITIFLYCTMSEKHKRSLFVITFGRCGPETKCGRTWRSCYYKMPPHLISVAALPYVQLYDVTAKTFSSEVMQHSKCLSVEISCVYEI